MLLNNNLLTRIKWLIAFLLYGYIIHKAVSVEITQDEAFSYLLVKTNNFRAMAASANTHWLNSLAMKLFLVLPGEDSLWKIRILSLLCWPVYCYSTIQLSILFKNKLSGLAFFMVAVLNPFLIFYFSLARGYAPACSFIMLALWYMARVLQTDEIRPGKWLPVFQSSALAVMANFTSFYFFMGLTIVYYGYLLGKKQLNLILQRPFQKLNVLVVILSVFAVSGLLVIKYFGHDLEFGSRSDLIGSMFGSQWVNSLNIVASAEQFSTADEHYDVSGIYRQYGLVLFIISLVALVYTIWNNIKTGRLSIGGFTTYIIFAILSLCLLFSLLFNTPYLMDRSALFLYPLMAVCLFTVADMILPEVRTVMVLKSGVAILLLAVCSYNFFKSYNTRYFNEWSLQSNTREGLDYLRRADAKNVGMDIWHYSVYENYYTVAFPDRYHFKAESIGLKEMLTTTDSARFERYDHLFLSPPYNENNAVIKNWRTKMLFRESEAKILVRK
ncbi:MAG: hypothetical protein ABWZ25_00580 [Chitinophagaceae bacterium]